MTSRAVRDETVEDEYSSLAALRYPAFRYYFAGQLVSVSGTWMQAIAQQVVIYDLTKSELALGLVSCAQGLPALLLTPFAGVIVERFQRRKILIFTQTFMMALAFILAALQFANVLQVWHIVALSLGIGLANALDAPARQAFVVEMVGREHLSSGIVLNSIMFNAARVFGPALGGLALKSVGPAWCFFLNGASFLAVIAGLVMMQVPYIRNFSGRIAIVRPLLEGVQFVRTHSTILPLLMLSTVASVFGMTFAVLIPAFADQVLKDSQIGTSALATAQGVGAILAGIVVARANSRGVRGRLLVFCALAAPITTILLATSTAYITALPAIVMAGFTLIAEFVLMNTLIQTQVPDEFRGRVLSLYTLTFFGLSPFSSLLIGELAQQIGTNPAIIIYGIMGFLGTALIFWRAPQLWRLP